MNDACLIEILVYYADIISNDKNYNPKLYSGSKKTSFKRRYSNYKKNHLIYHCTNMVPSYQQNIRT